MPVDLMVADGSVIVQFTESMFAGTEGFLRLTFFGDVPEDTECPGKDDPGIKLWCRRYQQCAALAIRPDDLNIVRAPHAGLAEPRLLSYGCEHIRCGEFFDAASPQRSRLHAEDRLRRRVHEGEPLIKINEDDTFARVFDQCPIEFLAFTEFPFGVVAVQRHLHRGRQLALIKGLQDVAERSNLFRPVERLLVRVGCDKDHRGIDLRPDLFRGGDTIIFTIHADVQQQQIRTVLDRCTIGIRTTAHNSNNCTPESGHPFLEIGRHDPFIISDDDPGSLGRNESIHTSPTCKTCTNMGDA